MSLKFPRLFALARDQQVSVCQAWQEAWAPALPVALSDQRADDLIRMQTLLGDCQLSEGPDAWVWQEPRFSARAVYQRLLEQAATEDPTFLRLWRAAWKSQLLLKIRIFAWLLLRRRLKTRAFLHRVIPDISTGCALCASAEETCEHLFITCPVSLVGLATGQCGPTRDLILGGFLEILRGGTAAIIGGVAAALLHTLVHMGTSEQSHIQGTHPLSRCHPARREGT